MARYRKRPVVIDAVHFNGTEASCIEVTEFLSSAERRWKPNTLEGGYIVTLEGEMEFRPGDWIIRGLNGEFYPCKPDIFETSYEPVEDDSSHNG